MSDPTYIVKQIESNNPTIRASPEMVTIPRALFDRIEATIYDALVLWGDQSDTMYKHDHIAKKRRETRQLAEEVSAYATQKGTP